MANWSEQSSTLLKSVSEMSIQQFSSTKTFQINIQKKNQETGQLKEQSSPILNFIIRFLVSLTLFREK